MLTSPHYLLLIGLLAALGIVLWLKSRPPQTPQVPTPRAPVNPYPGPRYLDTPEPWEKFSGKEMRMTIFVAMKRGENVSALAVSELFKRERPTEFTDGDLDRHALLLIDNGRPAQALPLFTALINRPTPYPTYNNRGYALLLMGEYERAIPDFDQAIAIDPGHAFAHNNRGLAYLRLGKVANALVDITYSLQLDPDNAYAHRNLGIYYYEQGDWPAALANLEHSAQLGPNTPDLPQYLKLVKAHLA